MKKIISILMVILMVFSFVTPAMAAAEDYSDPVIKNPLVYVRGAGKNIYKNNDENDELIYPVTVDTQAIIDALDVVAVDLVKGMLSDDYSDYVDTVYSVFAPIFEDVVLGKDGTPMDNSGNGPQDFVPYKTSGFRVWDNNFNYDFRLSLLDTADELKNFIDLVKTNTQRDKVALLGRCLGTNLMAAYLTKYKDHALASISNIILYVPATDGVDLISKLFSGKLVVKTENIDDFVEYFIESKNLIEDPTLRDFITVLVEMFKYVKVLGLSADAFQLLVDRLQGELIPKLGLASFASFPSYWSMVCPEDYADAKKLMFEGQEDEYAGLIEKIDEYYTQVQLPFRDLLKELAENKMGISIIAKYDIPNIPISEESLQLGDFIASTKQLSYGATCADHGKVLTQSYIDSLESAKYLSPDHKVDASTCLFPDNTWFMKNTLHDFFPDDGNRLLSALVDSKGTMTVSDNENFPQYIQYVPVEGEEEGVFVPVEGVDTEEPQEGSNEERFSIFIRFFTAILKFFTKLFNGELFKK